MKISWEETFMQVALIFSARSHCIQARVGAVIAHMAAGKQAIISAGYNGSPRGVEHCDVVGCANYDPANGCKLPGGYCRGAHAEINAINNAAREGARIDGATLFCTLSPCYECAKHIINAGLHKVIWLKRYSEKFPAKPGVVEEENRALELLGKRIICHQIDNNIDLTKEFFYFVRLLQKQTPLDDKKIIILP